MRAKAEGISNVHSACMINAERQKGRCIRCADIRRVLALMGDRNYRFNAAAGSVGGKDSLRLASYLGEENGQQVC
jgi:hypothetical protein